MVAPEQLSRLPRIGGCRAAQFFKPAATQSKITARWPGPRRVREQTARIALGRGLLVPERFIGERRALAPRRPGRAGRVGGPRTNAPRSGFRARPDHFDRTIISAQNRSRVATKHIGRGLSINHPAARLLESILTAAPCGGPSPQERTRLRTFARCVRAIALTSRLAVVTKDRVWAEVASAVGEEVGLAEPALCRASVAVLPASVTYSTSG